MSNTVLFGKVKDTKLAVFNFRGQLQCRMGGKREGPIETCLKFWNLNPLTANGQEILRIPAWKKSVELVKKELEAALEKEVLPATIPESPTVRRMTLGMNSPLVVPSLFARATVEKQQVEFSDGWDPLFIEYTAALYFHTCDIKINSWTTQAKKLRGSMPPKFEVREILRTLDRTSLESGLPIWDDGRMIVEEGHIALKDEMKFATRKYRAPYGLEQVEMRQKGKELDAAGSLYVALTEYKKQDPATPSPLSVGTPGDRRNGPVEDRFRKILERRQAELGEESTDETISETGEEMDVGNTPEPKPAELDFTAQELLRDLTGDDWADSATPPLTSSPRKNLELPLTSETSNMDMILLSAEEMQKNTFEGNKDMFLGTLDKKAWRDFLSEFDREMKSETTLDDFKEELWNTVVKFGEPVLMATGLDEKARKELLSKMVKLRETRRKTKDDDCEDGSILKKKTDDKKIEGEDTIKTSNMIKSTIILKARAGGRHELEGSDRYVEIESVMIVTTPPSKGMKSRKSKREMEELSSPSVDAVSENNLRETAPMIFARWKTTAYKSSSGPRRLTEIAKEIEASTTLVTEEDFKPRKAGSKKGSTSGQTWERDVGRELISSEHQVVGKQVSNDPLEKNATMNTARPWWVALETMKELEDCLKKLDQGVSRKRRNWATQQKAEVNKLDLGSQLKRTRQSLLRDYFEEAM